MKLNFKSSLAYIFSGGLSIIAAFFVASQFFGHSSGEEKKAAAPQAAKTKNTVDADAEPIDLSKELEGGKVDVDKGNGEKTNLDEGLESFLAPYNYDAENRRDPFREYKSEGSTIGGEMQEEGGLVVGPLRPLQRFELDEIQLVGIIWDVEEPKAMFLDPTKKIHILNKDERIGRKNGYIAAIREGEVVVVEAVKVRNQLAFTTKVMKITK